MNPSGRRSLVLVFLLIGVTAAAQKGDISRFTWDIREVYPDEKVWLADLEKLSARDYFQNISSVNSAAELSIFCNNLSELMRDIRQLSVYIDLREMTEPDFQSYEFRRKLNPVTGRKYGAIALLFEEFEVSAGELQTYLASAPELQIYERLLYSLVGENENIPADSLSKILVEIHDRSLTYTLDFNTLRQSITYPEVVLSSGDTLKIDEFTDYRQYRLRTDREKIYKAKKTALIPYANLYANMVLRKIGDIHIQAAVNGQKPLEYMLKARSIPASYYQTFVEAINDNLSLHHRYITLMNRLLGYDTAQSWDLYVVPEFEESVTYPVQDGLALIRKALEPYGGEYLAVIDEAAENRWIDIRKLPYKNATTRYLDDPHPFVSVLYDSSYNAVRSLGHELGHATEYVLSAEKYPYPLMFIPELFAEVPANVNEALINHYLLQRSSGPDPYIVAQTLFYLNGSLFVTAMNAEVEFELHKQFSDAYLDQAAIREIYLNTRKKYYGEELGIAAINELDFAGISDRWFVHEFYYLNWFNYSIGTVIASHIREGLQNGQLSKGDYLEFITSGETRTTTEILELLGIDLESPDAYTPVFNEISSLLEILETMTD